MAPKFTRREALFGLGALLFSGCIDAGKEPLPAGVPVEDSAPPAAPVELKGEIYTVDLSDNFVPYPLSEFDEMIYTVPKGTDDLRGMLEVANNSSPVSWGSFVNSGAGHRVKINLREEYLARTKDEKNLKYGVLPIFSNVKKKFEHFANIKKEYDYNDDVVLDDVRIIDRKYVTMAEKAFVDKHEAIDLESLLEDAGLPKKDRLRLETTRKKVAKVKNIQKLLQLEGLYKGVIDGLYGGGVRRAVVKFQERNGMQADGDIGKTTAKWLSPSSRTKLEMERVMDTLDHRVYYATFVLNDDDRSKLTDTVARELGILDKKGEHDFKGTMDFFDKIDFKEKSEYAISPKQGFRLEVPDNYNEGMKLEIEVYKNERDADGKKVPREQRQPTFIVYQKVDDGRVIELMRAKTVVGGWNKDHDECDINPIGVDEPTPPGWKDAGVSDDGTLKYIKKCVVREFSTPSTDNAHLNYLVLGPSWIFPAWQDLSDVKAIRMEHVPGVLNAFGPYHLPISDRDREIPAEHAWNTNYNTSSKFSGIAMHSTNSPNSIDKPGAGSHGCMRLNNVVAGRLAGFLMNYIPKRTDIDYMTDKGIVGRERGLAIMPFDQKYSPTIKILPGPAPSL